jgi:hypothetical protein
VGAATEIVTLRIITRATSNPFCFGLKLCAAHLQHVACLGPRFPRLDQAVLNKICYDRRPVFGIRRLRGAHVVRQFHHAFERDMMRVAVEVMMMVHNDVMIGACKWV